MAGAPQAESVSVSVVKINIVRFIVIPFKSSTKLQGPTWAKLIEFLQYRAGGGTGFRFFPRGFYLITDQRIFDALL